ncbi:MAG: bis(5'-nucleosyl)-tetraphosphatase (symmetrical) YqeK [Lachnospiraceae bacterium]|nr:bis(5'-nucleosyl)-tetraphosphatase (symmetrical) YqeK [Lachnospiraceae bacterium]
MKADNEIEKMRKTLKKYMDADRYYHTQGVRYTAAALAMAHGEDIGKAELAGLLHDSAKNIPEKEQLSLCEKNGIPISEIERKSPYLLHAKLGAYIAEKKYGVADPEVLEAIRWHTTGTEGMSRLSQIIFIADYIEPRRFKAGNLDEVRRMAFRDLDECCYIILRDTLGYLKMKGAFIDTETEKAFHFYEKTHNARIHKIKE